MTRDNVDDLVAPVEDAVRWTYVPGRADAMKRVMELAQSDDPDLRATALLGPAEPPHPTPSAARCAAASARAARPRRAAPRARTG